MDGIDGSVAVASCADEVGAHAQVITQGAGAVPVSRHRLVSFRAAQRLLGGVVRPGDQEVPGEQPHLVGFIG